MPLRDPDKSVGHSFGLEIDGAVISNITEVTGLKMEQDIIELKQNTPDGKLVVKKVPGRPKPGEVTLTRAATVDGGFEPLVRAAHLGKAIDAEKTAAVILYDSEGTPLKRYTLRGVWPRSLEIGTFRSGDSSVLSEKLILAYEQLQVE